jgi:hypothetical protein
VAGGRTHTRRTASLRRLALRVRRHAHRVARAHRPPPHRTTPLARTPRRTGRRTRRPRPTRTVPTGPADAAHEVHTRMLCTVRHDGRGQCSAGGSVCRRAGAAAYHHAGSAAPIVIDGGGAVWCKKGFACRVWTRWCGGGGILGLADWEVDSRGYACGCTRHHNLGVAMKRHGYGEHLVTTRGSERPRGNAARPAQSPERGRIAVAPH